MRKKLAFKKKKSKFQLLLLLFSILSIGIYVITRFFALDKFPIYFFCDEAIHPVTAVELWQRHFRDNLGNLFPIYFPYASQWNLGITVYFHLISVLLFGKSIIVTRATSAFFSLLGTIACALIMKYIFKTKTWWMIILFLTITPAWFLHSRTAFETTIMVSCYAIFLLCYLLYRYKNPRFLYPAICFGACTFYAYTNGQTVMLLSGVLLLISDFKYHIKNWKTMVGGFLLLLIVTTPFLLFRWQHASEIQTNLTRLSSYWLQPISLQEKMRIFLNKYLWGLSPQFWFLGKEQTIVRHEMKNYSYLLEFTLPLFILGLVLSLYKIKESSYRTILIALLAAPFGAALVDIGITRVLMFVIPANILITLAWDKIVSFITSKKIFLVTSLFSFIVLSFISFFMFYDAIEKAPLWYQDYSMSGLQWGTKQLFQEAIPEYVSKNPEKKIKVSSTWSNGTDIFIRFFNLGPNVEIGHINEFLHATEKLDQNITFIMTKEEYLRAQTSKKFKSVLPEKTLQYPNGSDAFYFVSNLEYVDNISQILQMEKEEKNRLVEEVVKYNGETIQVKHSLLDSGSAKNLFDNNIETIIKGQEANPFILEVIFPYPKEIKNITLNLQNINVDWKAVLFTYTNKQVEYTGHYNFEPNSFYTKLELTFDQGPEKISKIYLAIKNSNLGEIANIHLYDLIL